MTTTAATLGGARRPTAFFAPLARLVQALKRARAKRRTELALANLEDHVLLDIGIDPSKVRRSDRGLADWAVQTQSTTARIVFVGR